MIRHDSFDDTDEAPPVGDADASSAAALAPRWMAIESPDGADVERAASVLGTTVEHIFENSNARRPALSVEGDVQRLTMRTLQYVDPTDSVETGQLDVFIRGSLVVSVHRPPSHVEQPATPPSVDVGEDHERVVVTLCRWAIDGYDEVVADLFVDVGEVETSVFSTDTPADTERIYLLKREVAEARRAVTPLAAPLEEFAQSSPRQSAEFKALGDRLHRLVEAIEQLDSMLSSVFDAHVARISLQQNEDMRKISAAAALVVVPSLIAGIYGMNFKYMPELSWHYGYPMAIGLMIAVVAILFVSFKRSGWL